MIFGTRRVYLKSKNPRRRSLLPPPFTREGFRDRHTDRITIYLTNTPSDDDGVSSVVFNFYSSVFLLFPRVHPRLGCLSVCWTINNRTSHSVFPDRPSRFCCSYENKFKPLLFYPPLLQENTCPMTDDHQVAVAGRVCVAVSGPLHLDSCCQISSVFLAVARGSSKLNGDPHLVLGGSSSKQKSRCSAGASERVNWTGSQVILLGNQFYHFPSGASSRPKYR